MREFLKICALCAVICASVPVLLQVTEPFPDMIARLMDENDVKRNQVAADGYSVCMIDTSGECTPEFDKLDWEFEEVKRNLFRAAIITQRKERIRLVVLAQLTSGNAMERYRAKKRHYLTKSYEAVAAGTINTK